MLMKLFSSQMLQLLVFQFQEKNWLRDENACFGVREAAQGVGVFTLHPDLIPTSTAYGPLPGEIAQTQLPMALNQSPKVPLCKYEDRT